MADRLPQLADDFMFPRRAQNRPGLDRIAYRIGRYPDFREQMLRLIDAAPALSSWTHREPDDAGIALIESAAIVGDIIAFYQDLYANEVYLRSIAWPESLAERLRLVGYRLRPPMGGRATFAIAARSRVTIREGFPVKAELANASGSATFQTDAELVAEPHLSRFNLYRPRAYPTTLSKGTTRFEIASVAGATDAPSLGAFDLKVGDRLMVVPPEPVWRSGTSTNLLAMTAAGRSITAAMAATKSQPATAPTFKIYHPGYTSLPRQQASQTIKVTKVTRLVGRLVVEVDTPIADDWDQPVSAWRVNRAFRHFGHNAPPKIVTPTGNPISGSTQADTKYERAIAPDAERGGSSSSIRLPPALIPLDAEVPDLRTGLDVIVQLRVVVEGESGFVGLTIARRIEAIDAATIGYGNLNGASTLITLNEPPIRQKPKRQPKADIRHYRIHEVTSPALTLRPLPNPAAIAFDGPENALLFWGTAAEARLLAGRRLYFQHLDGRDVLLRCTNEPEDFDGAGSRRGRLVPPPGAGSLMAGLLAGRRIVPLLAEAAPRTANVPRFWPLSFDRTPAPFRPGDFEDEAPSVTVFGNLADASQGEEERAVLGNGDNRERWQTFPLPKSPVTYFIEPESIPPHRPALEIWVGGRRWTQVDSFYRHGPDETVYIVREEAEGRSFVQFGDGEAGARLPSGIRNIEAVYRSGSAARGPLKPGATPSAPERPSGFDKLLLAGIVSGGADAEEMEGARVAGPGSVQSLGRLVSIRDCETETLGVPGVVAADASWGLHEGIPAIILCVLLAAGREAEFESIRTAIATALRRRGPDRHAVVIRQARIRYALLDVVYAADPTLQRTEVERSLRVELGLAGDTPTERRGIFGLHARRLGHREYASRIEGRLQNVPGIVWCRVAALGLFAPEITDPATQPLPPSPRPALGVLPCDAHEMLQLAPQHLTLVHSADAGREVRA